MITPTTNLKGKALVATPQLKDPFFEQSVCYICQHDSEGSLGFVINKPIDMREKDLLLDQKFDINEKDFSQRLLNGGPMHTDRGFVIHMQGSAWKNTLQIGPAMFVTTSQEILSAIAHHEIADHYLIVLGFSAWEPGQLEAELIENTWLISDVDTNLVFAAPFEARWTMAMQQLGIQSIASFTSEEGHA